MNSVSTPNLNHVGMYDQTRHARADGTAATPDNRAPVINRDDVPLEIRQAAEGMEGMFLDYMMQQMRKTVPDNEMDLNSPATKIYQSMMDSETAEKAAKGGGVGLADQIIAYMMSERYNLGQGHGVPDSKVQGGTHAGQPIK